MADLRGRLGSRRRRVHTDRTKDAAPALSLVSLDPVPAIEAYEQDVDRTLLRENLKLTPAERIEKMISVLAFAQEVRRAGREARGR